MTDIQELWAEKEATIYASRLGGDEIIKQAVLDGMKMVSYLILAKMQRDANNHYPLPSPASNVMWAIAEELVAKVGIESNEIIMDENDSPIY